jgi:uncharacterized protein YcaQ
MHGARLRRNGRHENHLPRDCPPAGRLGAAARPPATADGILGVVKQLGRLQLDPTSVVARSHLLVLWSRLGAYDPATLDELLWKRRDLFEYRAFIVPTDDYAFFRARMRAFPAGDSKRSRDVREWMSSNAGLRRSILSQLRRRGPLRLRDFTDRAAVGWKSSGWNDERNVGQMLDFLLAQGKVLVSRRESGHRLWDLAARVLPADVRARPALRSADLAHAERELRVRPGASALPWPPGDRHPRVLLEALERSGRAQRVTVEGLPGVRYVHADHLTLLDRLEEGAWEPRTTLLSPFDTLINDRDRTEALFGFRFRLEIYVPKAKRQYGYFVLPILHGDRLVGRIDPEYDRKAKRLRVKTVHWEPGAPRDARGAAKKVIAELEGFLQSARA